MPVTGRWSSADGRRSSAEANVHSGPSSSGGGSGSGSGGGGGGGGSGSAARSPPGMPRPARQSLHEARDGEGRGVAGRPSAAELPHVGGRGSCDGAFPIWRPGGLAKDYIGEPPGFLDPGGGGPAGERGASRSDGGPIWKVGCYGGPLSSRAADARDAGGGSGRGGSGNERRRGQATAPSTQRESPLFSTVALSELLESRSRAPLCWSPHVSSEPPPLDVTPAPPPPPIRAESRRRTWNPSCVGSLERPLAPLAPHGAEPAAPLTPRTAPLGSPLTPTPRQLGGPLSSRPAAPTKILSSPESFSPEYQRLL